LGSVGNAGNVIRAGSARDMRIAGPDGGVGCGGRNGVDDEVSSGWREGEDGRGVFISSGIGSYRMFMFAKLWCCERENGIWKRRMEKKKGF
jgi:hypothetical protein